MHKDIKSPGVRQWPRLHVREVGVAASVAECSVEVAAEFTVQFTKGGEFIF